MIGRYGCKWELEPFNATLYVYYQAPFDGIKRVSRSTDFGAGSAFTTTPVPGWPHNEDLRGLSPSLDLPKEHGVGD